ncbi:hypothetical protein ACFY2W_36300 [Streptomyces sp. NPDC001262]|uniref:hypothetical protein n=1 Tax=Streptomyces sp. NPDC001262 TaxID=3364552 RepID=UPI0036A3AB6F
MERNLKVTGDGDFELTIRWNKQEDDPTGVLYGWAAKGYLDSFLRAFPKPTEAGSPADADDAYHMAVGLNWLAELTDRRLELLLLILRDQHKASWGTIANALEVSRSTARSRYQKVAKQYAEHGHWVDENGLQTGPPAEVKKLVADRLRARDTEDRARESAVAQLQAGDRVRHRLDKDMTGTVVRTMLGQWVIDWDGKGELAAAADDIVPLS